MLQVMFSLFLILVGQSAIAQIKPGVITNEQQVQNWSSFVLSGRSARMTTSSVTKTGTSITLALEMNQPCTNLEMKLIFGLAKPRETAGTLRWLITMRVDYQQPVFGNIDYNASVGDKTAIFTLNKLQEFPALFRAMVDGQSILMRADTQDGKLVDTVAFPLFGFTASYNRMKSLCQQLVATRPSTNSAGPENLRQLPRHPDLPQSPNAPQTPALPRHPSSGV